MRRAQIARLNKLESLSLNCGHPRDGFKDGGDGIIQLVKELPQLMMLRVQPFTAFGSFLGDWEFVADCKARRATLPRAPCHQPRVALCSAPPGAQAYKPEFLREMEIDGESPYPDTSGSGFEDEDMNWTYVSRSVRVGQSKLAELQQALPRRCRLTNSGHHRGHMRPWGEASTELPAWHVWKASTYKGMDGGLNTLRGINYLQCGPRDSDLGEPRRFASYDEWFAKSGSGSTVSSLIEHAPSQRSPTDCPHAKAAL